MIVEDDETEQNNEDYYISVADKYLRRFIAYFSNTVAFCFIEYHLRSEYHVRISNQLNKAIVNRKHESMRCVSKRPFHDRSNRVKEGCIFSSDRIRNIQIQNRLRAVTKTIARIGANQLVKCNIRQLAAPTRALSG